MTGTELAGYRLERVIGSGGMGIVYCARHLHLGRRDAVKLMAPEHAATPDARRRFIRESRAAASLNHPNIVTVYSAGEADGQLYIAMQFIDGSDLRTLRQAQHILAPEQLLGLLEQVAAALDAAHEHGLVHRDVKPGNVLVDGAHAYLTDFGLTKDRTLPADTTSVTAEGGFVGTVHYSAPEQITGSDVDWRADIYSLGAVVYECLTGDVPYPRSDSMTTALAHMSDPIPKVTAKRPDLPPAIDDVIARALAKVKDERYQSCGEFYEAVADALAEAPSAVPKPARKRARRKPSDPDARTAPEGARSGRRRVPLWASAALLLPVGVLIAVVAIGSNDKPTPAVHTHTSRPPTPTPHHKSPFKIVTSERVARRPFGLAVDSGGVWVSSFDQDAIRRVDPSSGQVTGERIPVGDGPFAVAVGSSFVWVANNHADAVQRVDPTTSTAYHGPINVCNGPVSVRAAAGFIWVACENDDMVARINPATGAVVGRTHVGDLPRGLTATSGVIWVADRRDGAVTRINASTGSVIGAPIRVGRDPHFMTVAQGLVWVTLNDDDTVARIRAKTARVVGRPIRVGHAPWGIAYGLGSVWVANSASNTVTRINPRTGRVVGQPIKVGRQPSGVAAGAGSVWVTDNNQGSVTRIRPLKSA